jgi:hypothetical protein
VERARDLAKAFLGKVAEGEDPAGDRKSYRVALSVSQLCDLYVEAAEAGLILGRKGSSKKASTSTSIAAELSGTSNPYSGGIRWRRYDSRTSRR